MIDFNFISIFFTILLILVVIGLLAQLPVAIWAIVIPIVLIIGIIKNAK